MGTDVSWTSIGCQNVKKKRRTSDVHKTSCAHRVIAATGILTFFG